MIQVEIVQFCSQTKRLCERSRAHIEAGRLTLGKTESLITKSITLLTVSKKELCDAVRLLNSGEDAPHPFSLTPSRLPE